MPKPISNGDFDGLFRPYTRVMAKARKQQLVDGFLANRVHHSRSGFTARIITDYCIANKVRFLAEYSPEWGYKIMKVDYNAE